MTPEEKDELRRRVQAHMGKAPTREEQKARKQRSKERKARRNDGAHRSRTRFEESGDWDEIDDFEAMGSRRQAPPRPGSAEIDKEDSRDLRGTALGVVVGLARDGARIDVEGRRLRLPLRGDDDLAVGDRVRVLPLPGELARLVARDERRTELARADPGRPQRRRVLAANVDLALVVLSVGGPPFKPGLFDRFNVALAAGGIAPRMVVNKVDLLPSPEERAALDRRLVPYRLAGVRVHLVSTVRGDGVDDLRRDVAGSTIVAVGHSGVGKSSLLNALDPGGGERATSRVRASDGKGRHTTTASELRTLAGGTVLIDTPGIRSLGLAAEQLGALDEVFPEVAALALECRFTDCSHGPEPDCAVRAALEAGRLDRSRWEAYGRLAGE